METTPSVRNATNDMIVPYAILRHHATSRTGTFSTFNIEKYSPIYRGAMPGNLFTVMTQRRKLHRSIKQVIYSYNTPVAWLDGDVWVIPHVTYSQTTGQKHQSRLHRLPNRVSVPEDVSYDEYMRVLAGKMIFDYANKRTVPGPNF